MKQRTIALLTLIALAATGAPAVARGTHAKPPVEAADKQEAAHGRLEAVHGYKNKEGHAVAGYSRTRADGTPTDNLSYHPGALASVKAPAPGLAPTAAALTAIAPGAKAPLAAPGNLEAVKGYTTKSGHQVAGYERTRADGIQSDNFSAKGNLDPFTGKIGTEAIAIDRSDRAEHHAAAHKASMAVGEVALPQHATPSGVAAPAASAPAAPTAVTAPAHPAEAASTGAPMSVAPGAPAAPIATPTPPPALAPQAKPAPRAVTPQAPVAPAPAAAPLAAPPAAAAAVQPAHRYTF